MNYKILYDPTDFFEDILNLDKQFFDSKYLWKKEYQKAIFDRNNESFILVAKDKKIIGYLNYLCISKQKYDEIINSNVAIDEFEIKDIEKYHKGNNYITINSVVIDKNNQNKGLIKLINHEFLKKLKELKLEGITIARINGIAISNDGQKYFERLGFNQIKKLDYNNYLYELKENCLEILENRITY